MFAPGIILAGIVVAVVLGVLILYGLLATVLPERAERSSESLADRAEEILPPRTVFGRMDRGFAKIVRDSYYGLTADGAILWMLLVGGILGTLVLIISNELLLVGFAFLMGMLLTYLFFLVSRNRRRMAIQEQLPDGCFQLARGLRAGLALPEALQQSSAFTPTPLGNVFEKCSQSMRLGLAATGVMNRASDDVRLSDFDQLSSVVALNAQSGGDLPRLLDRLAENIRSRNQYRGYFRSVTSLARISAIFVALGAPVAALIYFLFQNELFMGFIGSRLGITMIVAAVILEIVGIVWVLWLLRRQDEV